VQPQIRTGLFICSGLLICIGANDAPGKKTEVDNTFLEQAVLRIADNIACRPIARASGTTMVIVGFRSLKSMPGIGFPPRQQFEMEYGLMVFYSSDVLALQDSVMAQIMVYEAPSGKINMN
jgi:hypothetical protein